ncbi:hypothetical protein DB347_17155 [Opitutaceae bacterium EW11]|nr:hypothetical protein DB347_17155 [Opitutaceae bacterium EW11]
MRCFSFCQVRWQLERDLRTARLRLAESKCLPTLLARASWVELYSATAALALSSTALGLLVSRSPTDEVRGIVGLSVAVALHLFLLIRESDARRALEKLLETPGEEEGNKPIATSVAGALRR